MKQPFQSFQERLDAEDVLMRNGVPCVSVAQFARITGFTRRTIANLINRGNRFGRLPAQRTLGRTYIPLAEVFRFVFVEPGRHGLAFVFDTDGNKQYVLDETPQGSVS